MSEFKKGDRVRVLPGWRFDGELTVAVADAFTGLRGTVLPSPVWNFMPDLVPVQLDGIAEPQALSSDDLEALSIVELIADLSDDAPSQVSDATLEGS